MVQKLTIVLNMEQNFTDRWQDDNKSWSADKTGGIDDMANM
ncbi:hypothetical protein CsSME_00051364 [Camellia sinensis var. sinensis]